ncbi:MAG TPA: hypothetical protein PKA58_19805, partial [Polyangium sp.]|nr:hypothetical protein [Polyangium sp.]
MTNPDGDGLHVPPAAPRRGTSAKRVPVGDPKLPLEEEVSDPRPHKRIEDVPLGWRIADGYLAIGAFLMLEIVVVAIGFRREFVGAYEPILAIKSLWPIGFAAAAPI